MYDPQVNDYVRWTTELGMVHEGWVYFKADQSKPKKGWITPAPVSYTHLTLPTICSV